MSAAEAIPVLDLQRALVSQGFALVESCEARPERCNGQWNGETAEAFDAWVARRRLTPGPGILTEGGLLVTPEVAQMVRVNQPTLVAPAPAEVASPPPSPEPAPRRGTFPIWGWWVLAGGAILAVVLGGAAIMSEVQS